jgi:hypothetical protein
MSYGLLEGGGGVGGIGLTFLGEHARFRMAMEGRIPARGQGGIRGGGHAPCEEVIERDVARAVRVHGLRRGEGACQGVSGSRPWPAGRGGEKGGKSIRV